MNRGLINAGFRLACRSRLCRVIIACCFRVTALSGHAALALSPSSIAPELIRIQLSVVCRCGQSGGVINLLARRCLLLGLPYAIAASGLPDITGRTALAVRPDALNAKYHHHVITNATDNCHNRDPVPAKFKHVTNIETCTLLCCDHITLWKALDANMVENGAHCSDKNVLYQWIGW